MSRRGRRAVALTLLVLVGLSCVLRVRTALSDPNFDATHAEGMLKSDPALLTYLTGRILEAGGTTPADWRADPRVQHPYLTDVPAEFTVGQEFLLAWTQLGLRGLGREPPLHLTALWLFGFLASLCVVGVYGLARELTRGRTSSVAPALFAACLWCVLPANYRTMGFILVREDLAFPALGIALWLVVRAGRVNTRAAWGGAGLALAVALATWHAMGFFVLLLLLAPLAWLILHGESLAAQSKVAWVLVAPCLAAVCVPALREAGTLGSAPFLVGVGLIAAGWVQRRGVARAGRLSVALGAAGALTIVAGMFGASGSGRGAYAHVWDVLWAKLRFLGVPPEDPTLISFDARLLWQGPFETLQGFGFLFQLGYGLFFVILTLPLAWWGWRRPGGRVDLPPGDGRRVAPGEAVLLALVLLSLVASWLVARVVILPGLLAPVAAAVLLVRFRSRSLTGAILDRDTEIRRGVQGPPVVILLMQIWSFMLPLVRDFSSPWYQPPGRQTEIAALVAWVGENVPAEEAITADFMNGTALLAQCGNPIVLQPKYETERSRRQAERFLTGFFFDSPAQFLALVRKRFKTRYLLIDRFTLGYLSRWTAGLPVAAPLPAGSAAELFLSQESDVLENVAGATLVYRSPETIRQSDGTPYDLFRLYRLD